MLQARSQTTCWRNLFWEQPETLCGITRHRARRKTAGTPKIAWFHLGKLRTSAVLAAPESKPVFSVLPSRPRLRRLQRARLERQRREHDQPGTWIAATEQFPQQPQGKGMDRHRGRSLGCYAAVARGGLTSHRPSAAGLRTPRAVSDEGSDRSLFVEQEEPDLRRRRLPPLW